MGLKDLLFGKAGSEQSQSSSYGEQSSSSFGRSVSGSSSSSTGVSSSRDSVAFEELFRKLYGDASAAVAGVDTGALAGTAKALFTGGTGFLSQLMEAGAGERALEEGLSDTSGRDAQLETLRTQLGDFFNEELMPGVTDVGVATGTFGGARDAVARAQAAKAVGGQFATGAASIISADQARRDASAAELSKLQQSRAATGVNALGSLYGLAAEGELAELTPLERLSSIFGDPTVLGEASSLDVASQISRAFSEDGSQSYGFERSSSTGRSTGGTQGLAQAFLGGGGVGLSFRA